MFFNERQSAIIKILEKRHSATVHFLAKELYVSEPTIRRDLKTLEENGKIKRTFGGAVISDIIKGEVPLILREQTNASEKEEIAIQALKYIKDGQIIFLDASSTVAFLLDHLSAFNDLTVITNSPKASLKLAEMKIKCLCTGGILLENSIAYVGSFAENFIRKLNADILFFSCRGITEDGRLTDSSLEESELRKIMMQRAKKTVFLCSSEKIGKEYMYNLCHVSQIDVTVSTAKLPQ